MPFSFAAPRPQNKPIYVVHKIGGDPGEGQFLTEPPREIPHGYACTYIPGQRQSNTLGAVGKPRSFWSRRGETSVVGKVRYRAEC